jgi:hypothetical protein
LVTVRLDRLNTAQWKRVCDVASLLLDTVPELRSANLSRECGDDQALLDAVLRVCHKIRAT